MSLKRKEIVDYIAKNNLTQKSGSGLYYVIKEAGDGVKPTSSSIVTVAYKGYYTDGEVLMKVVPAELHFLYKMS
jgi:FKBP-type peptidyl-prolyl cis-trans isomerase FkpA